MGTPGTVVDRGLEGIIVGATALCDVDGEAGRLGYRGYDIDDLAANATFEDVAYLLLFGALPNAHRLGDFNVRLAASRPLPPTLLEWLAGMPAAAAPIDVLRTAISALALSVPHHDEAVHPSTPRAAIGLVAKTPTILAAWDRIRRGLRPIEPLPHLSTAANFLYMRSGKMPIPEAERAFDTYLVLLADHAFNAATFAARVTASTQADLYASATAALAALGGDLHGGAPGNVMATLQAIGRPEAATTFVREALARGERLPGFGRRAYRVRDPRVRHLEVSARMLCEAAGAPWYAIARAYEDAAASELAAGHPERPLFANVEVYAAPTLFALGIPPDEFTCAFACGRMAGWTAHVLEQLADNRPIRPQAAYRGPARTAWLPPHARDGAAPAEAHA